MKLSTTSHPQASKRQGARRRIETTHGQPIYFIELESTRQGAVLVTNTATDGDGKGLDGYPLQYTQRINTTTGACTCGCKGFQDGIAPRADKEGITPTIGNGRNCKHIRKAAECGREWGYIGAGEVAAEQPAAKEEFTEFDYASYFESM